MKGSVGFSSLNERIWRLFTGLLADDLLLVDTEALVVFFGVVAFLVVVFFAVMTLLCIIVFKKTICCLWYT